MTGFEWQATGVDPPNSPNSLSPTTPTLSSAKGNKCNSRSGCHCSFSESQPRRRSPRLKLLTNVWPLTPLINSVSHDYDVWLSLVTSSILRTLLLVCCFGFQKQLSCHTSEKTSSSLLCSAKPVGLIVEKKKLNQRSAKAAADGVRVTE